MNINRRIFGLGAASVAFSALTLDRLTTSALANPAELVADPDGILDLASGFSYRIISEYGDQMSDGFTVPDRADGMGCFAISEDVVALVRNHEMNIDNFDTSGLAADREIATYGRHENGTPLPGGTTTIHYNMKTGERVREFRSLVGTVRNCSGGITPWGSWLTCEETMARAGDGVQQDHGWVFEVSASETGLQSPKPLKAMGRFNHEAAAIDRPSGVVYLTEDRNDGLLYRFIPSERDNLAKGGKLQALAFADPDHSHDTRNWGQVTLPVREKRPVTWIDLDNVESPEDDLRLRGAAKGAAIFARGEGIHEGNGEQYFCCTSGGLAEFGQVMRYIPSPYEGTDREAEEPGTLDLFYESPGESDYNYGDNITVAPQGYLIVCEDQYTDPVNNFLRIITPSGISIPLARLHLQTELAGACFSPDGSTLFVNIYGPTKTLAIKGPWNKFVEQA